MSTSRLLLATLLLAFAGPPLDLAAQPSVPGPSFEQVISLRGVGSPVIAPDGQAVVFSVSSADWEGNRFDSELWLARPGEAPFPLTHTEDGSSSSASWSPDGRWIAFLADRGDKQQLYLLRAAGGEARPLTDIEEGVDGYAWSPDGARIAFTRTAAEDPSRTAQEEAYGAFAIEDAEYRMRHLWLLDVPADPWALPDGAPCVSLGAEAGEDACDEHPEPRALTEGDGFTVGGFDWSPDGTRIVFEHRDTPLINAWTTADLSVVDVATGTVTPLVDRAGPDMGPLWSPDGEWIVFQTSGDDSTALYYENTHLARIPSGGGEPTAIPVDLDEDLSSLQWTPRGLFFLAYQKTERQLFELDPMTGTTRLVADTPRNIWSMDFTPDGSTIAFQAHTPTTLREIYRASMDDLERDAAEAERLTDLTQQIADWEVGTSEVISWASQDGTEIEGVLFKPADFDPDRQYPLFVVIHGGPTGIDYPTPIDHYVYPITQWLAKGAVVLQPNYRGSAGYGEAFRSLNVRNLGVGDAWDVLSGVDHLVEQGFVDETRMGAMGWSQGGYISAFLTTHTDRFQAISVGAGISNWMTYYVNTDIHPFTRQYLKATPWEDSEIYAVTSPMTTITEAATPTLIQHGEFDRRVPIPNAYELYQGLQDMGVETKLIVYKGFGHGITKPKERLAATWHNWQWFARHLWDETVELPVEEADTDEAEAATSGR